jgi:hypothetical protein
MSVCTTVVSTRSFWLSSSPRSDRRLHHQIIDRLERLGRPPIERVAANLAAYVGLFPDVVIGDTVPIPSVTDQPQWQNDYRQWLAEFARHVGRPIGFAVREQLVGRFGSAVLPHIFGAGDELATDRRDPLKV